MMNEQELCILQADAWLYPRMDSWIEVEYWFCTLSWIYTWIVLAICIFTLFLYTDKLKLGVCVETGWQYRFIISILETILFFICTSAAHDFFIGSSDVCYNQYMESEKWKVVLTNRECMNQQETSLKGIQYLCAWNTIQMNQESVKKK